MLYGKTYSDMLTTAIGIWQTVLLTSTCCCIMCYWTWCIMTLNTILYRMIYNCQSSSLALCQWITTKVITFARYLCQWAPAACLGFLLVSFGTVGALKSFEFSESGQPPLNTRRAEKSETQKFPPRCRHAHSFRILSLNSASRPPLFLPPYCCTSSCKYLTLWKFQSVALEPEILWKR